MSKMREALNKWRDKSPETRYGSLHADTFEAGYKAALAELAKQEPVGHVVEWVDGSLIHAWLGEPPPKGTPLYAAPVIPADVLKVVDGVKVLRATAALPNDHPLFKALDAMKGEGK